YIPCGNLRLFAAERGPTLSPHCLLQAWSEIVMERERGFTLIELLVTVGIASLLLFGGVPALADFVQAAESRSTSLKLVSRFNLARASAINTGRITTLCGSSDGTRCDRGWDKGILIFTDGGEAGVVDADDRVIRYDDPVTKGK